MKDIEKIIQSIPDAYKVLYDRVLIEQLYTQYQSRKIDDSASVQTITGWIRGKKLLLLAPGKSLLSKYEEIMAFIGQEKPFVISVNFLDPKYRMNACFVSNHKRMDVIGQELQRFPDIHTILTSNIPDTGREDCLYVDYDRYTNADEMISDNAGLMLLKLLAYCGATEIYLAGFDGFHHKHNGNYYRRELNLKAVSYTHLDVYKRQVLSRLPADPNRCGRTGAEKQAKGNRYAGSHLSRDLGRDRAGNWNSERTRHAGGKLVGTAVLLRQSVHAPRRQGSASAGKSHCCNFRYVSTLWFHPGIIASMRLWNPFQCVCLL